MNRRCLLVLHHSVYSGPQNTALRIYDELQRLGWETLVLMADGPGGAQERLEGAGVEVIRMPLHRVRATFDLKYMVSYAAGFLPEVLGLRRVLLNRKIDAVVLGGLANPHAAFAGWLAGVPVVWQILDTRLPRPYRALMMGLVRRLATSVMFTGEGLIGIHRAQALKRPHFVYFPPVDTERFAPSVESRECTRSELGVPADGFLVGAVANLNPQKGIEYFVRAAGLVCRDFSNVWFVVVGATYDTHALYLKRVLKEVAAANIPDGHFIFAHARNDIEKLYQALDVKVISSVPHSEGVPTTALEALSCGVPVVAADVGAVREVVQDGVTGYIVPPMDPTGLAGAIGRLLKAPDVRARMGVAGRSQALERFSITRCAEAHYRALEAAALST